MYSVLPVFCKVYLNKNPKNPPLTFNRKPVILWLFILSKEEYEVREVKSFGIFLFSEEM